MEKVSEDIGEKIIFKLTELNRLLEQIFEDLKNGKKLASPHSIGK